MNDNPPRYGQLTLLDQPAKKGMVWVRCDCGNEKQIRTSDVVSGRVTACGCQQQQWRQDGWKARQTRHGQSRTKLYRWWINQRLQKRLCAEWTQHWESFTRDIGTPPPHHRLKRPNRARPYGPDNFHWEGYGEFCSEMEGGI
jgi:hypothetical protein